MGLGRVELPTFPIRSGRSGQGLDVIATFHALDLSFPAGSLAARIVGFEVKQLPRPTVLDGESAIAVVFGKSRPHRDKYRSPGARV